MDTKIVNQSALTVVGMKYHGKNENGEIPNTWKTFDPRIKEIKNMVSPYVCYGICDNYNGESGEFDYVCALEVADTAEIPDGMVVWNIPECTYAVFPTTLRDLAKTYDYATQIWLPNSAYQLAMGSDFELYDQDYNLKKNENSVIYIYIPIIKKK